MESTLFEDDPEVQTRWRSQLQWKLWKEISKSRLLIRNLIFATLASVHHIYFLKHPYTHSLPSTLYRLNFYKSSTSTTFNGFKPSNSKLECTQLVLLFDVSIHADIMHTGIQSKSQCFWKPVLIDIQHEFIHDPNSTNISPSCPVFSLIFLFSISTLHPPRDISKIKYHSPEVWNGTH